MYNSKNDNTFELCLPTNVNGLINTLWLILDHNCKNQGVTKAQIKDRLRGMFLLDYHVFIRNKQVILDHKGYWIPLLTRIMNIYRLYLEDLLDSYGCGYIRTFKEHDIEYTVMKLLGIKIKGKIPEFDRAFLYDHDKVMRYVSGGDQTPFFDVYCAIATDELDKYIPRVYGYQMTPLTSVYNRANMNMVVPYHIRKCLETIWRTKGLDVGEYLRDAMWEYFDEKCIDNFRRYLNNHIGKIPRVGILCNVCYDSTLYNNYQYTNAGYYSNLEYCKERFKEFIKDCYCCH